MKPAKYGMLLRVICNGNTYYVMNMFLHDGTKLSTLEMAQILLKPFLEQAFYYNGKK